MRLRTLFAITLTMFALPALAVGQPVMPAPRELPSAPAAMPAAAKPELSVSFEVRTLKVPVGFCERMGVKLTGNTVLGDDDLRRILEAAQGQRDANVTQLPKVTALDGQEATVRNCEQRSFVTSLEVTKVKGQTVFVPKYTSIELGDTLTVSGGISTDAQTVTLRAKLTRRFIAGDVPLVPVTTQITPVFEGGSLGQPVPFTQFLQSPDVKTEQVEKHVIISSGHTIVLGGWKETGERPAKPRGLLKKDVPATEHDVVTFATVRVVHRENTAPMPREACADANTNVAYKYKLRNVAAADAALALNTFLTSKKLTARVTTEAEFNNVVVSAVPSIQKQIGDMLVALDKAPVQVMVQAMVMEVPHGSAITQWLTDDGKPNATSWTLTAREVKTLNLMIREAKGRGEIDILSRPQLQLADNQTGFTQIGQSFSYETTGLVKTAGGAVKVQSSIEYMPIGFTMRSTPRVCPDGKSVLLRTEAEYTWVSPSSVVLGKAADGSAITSPAFNTQSVNTTAAVRDGETLVLAMAWVNAPTAGSFFGAARQQFAGEKRVILVVLTPHIVRSEVENARVLAEEAAKQPGYNNVVDPSFPERYNLAARQPVIAPFAQQVHNGHFLTQTVWNSHFETGTDKLTPAGKEKLDSLARTRPAPDSKVYIQTARDLTAPVGKLADARTELDAKRATAVQKYLAAQPAIGAAIAYEVYVHDALEPSTATPVRPAGGSPK